MSFVSRYITNCFANPEAFAVACSVARASREVQHSLPKFDLHESIRKHFYGTLGGVVTLSLNGLPQILYQEPPPPTTLVGKIWNRITGIVNKVTSSLMGWVTQHTWVLVWIAGLAFVIGCGTIYYFAFYSPELIKGAEHATDPQDTSVLQTMGLQPLERLIQQKNEIATTMQDGSVSMNAASLPICQVCQEAPPNVACTKCGNLVLCSADVDKYKETFGGRCPVCRDIGCFLQIKIPGL